MVDLPVNNDINELATNSPIIFHEGVKVSNPGTRSVFEEKSSIQSSDISQKEEIGKKNMNKSGSILSSISSKNI